MTDYELTEVSGPGYYQRLIEKMQRAAIDVDPGDTIRGFHLQSGVVQMAEESMYNNDDIEEGYLPEISLAHSESNTQGELEIQEMLSRGGMGCIMLGLQRSFGRKVAVKRLPEETRSEIKARRQLLDEGKLTGLLEHPNIVPVHTLGKLQDDEPLMIMKRVEGSSWTVLIEDPHHPSWQNFHDEPIVRHLNIMKKVCHALEFAHSKGIAHLDIKPDNVMIGDFGEVYLLDWGAAADLSELDELARSEVVGSPSYIAPEQLHGKGASSFRTDVFLLGATLHEVLMGEPRHMGTDLQETLRKALTVKPFAYPKEVSSELAQIANRACMAAQEDRYESVRAFREAIEDYLRHRGAHKLYATASKKLDAFFQLLSELQKRANREIGERELRSVYDLFSQSRFGFEQTLQEWPTHPTAHARLQSCIELMIRFELHMYNPGAAKVLYMSLDTENQELYESIELMHQRIKTDADAYARLDHIQQQTTFAGHNWNRTIGLLCNGLLWALFLLGIGAVVRNKWIEVTPAINLGLAVGAFVQILIVAFVLRKLFFDNEIRRRFSYALFSLVGSYVVTRVVGLFWGMPLFTTLVSDFIAAGMFTAACAAFIHSSLWWGVAVVAGGLVLTGPFPEYMMEIAAGSAFLLNVVVAYIVRPIPGKNSAQLPSIPIAS